MNKLSLSTLTEASVSQECQKRFITATPADLFNFFHDATQMRAMEEDYRVVKSDIDKVRALRAGAEIAENKSD